MPKRDDIHKILLVGSGPILIGQACEFDYSGTQACKALREEGYEIVLVNSNPATIMTDPETADRTYVEPLTPECLEKIIANERPDALLPTLGGQTGLNVSLEVYNNGVLDTYGVEMIGARADVIRRAENRDEFKDAMREAGIEVLRSEMVGTVDEALVAADRISYPVIVRPSFTLGGTGGGTAATPDELREIARKGLAASLDTTVLIEESVYGWKEFEMEVMRDRNDNVVIICAIENLDHMGIHTGDSITVAPAQTLTDVEYQVMRDQSIAVMRAIGVETGGSNVQFCINPKNGRIAVIEMNPRVSRSSALASKATGFPIAKIAAKLAVGYTLDELSNDITLETPASFEPTLDYCVVKIPRFAFEKFPQAEQKLGVSMKSVGETMAIGTNMKEALLKAFRGLERGVSGFDRSAKELVADRSLEGDFATKHPDRIFRIYADLKAGVSIDDLYATTLIDPWFLDQLQQIAEFETELEQAETLTDELLIEAKRIGFSDKHLAELFPKVAELSPPKAETQENEAHKNEAQKPTTELDVRARRKAIDLIPVYRVVDTCAGEFEAHTPYLYSSYGIIDEARPSDQKKIIILGSGPNRIGQGIEFDYCCVHTVFALHELGYQTIMVNSNPETVSTDYDTADKLYFEPLTFEDVMNIYEKEQADGVIVQMGGQTPLNLSVPLAAAGVPVLGTSADSIDRAEDRERCRQLLDKLGLKQPASKTAMSVDEAKAAAKEIGLPVMIRPSYVLGGRAMMIAWEEDEVGPYVEEAFRASPEHPVLIDRFLDNAIEADVDVLCDGETAYVGGVMEHVEQAGVHSGDSACCTPPNTLKPEMVGFIKDSCRAIALELNVRGLLNVQIGVADDEMYIIEINPRASRTVPYLSKATGVQLAKLAARVAVGEKIADMNLPPERDTRAWFAVKEAVMPFDRFAGVDPILSPEMKSTGEVMGIDANFEVAYWKAQIAAGQRLASEGKAFLSANDEDKPWMVVLGKDLAVNGFEIVATAGTAAALAEEGVEAIQVNKLADGGTTVLDYMQRDEIVLVLNTPSGAAARQDEVSIRSQAILRDIPIITTRWGAEATVRSILHMQQNDWGVRALQDYY